MKKVYSRCLILWIGCCVFFLTGCAKHITAMQISDALNHDALYKSYNVQPTDLSLRSKCSAPPSVKIVNIESRTEDYVAFDDPFRKRFINPKEMMDGVSSYLKDGFAASNIKAEDQSTKVLQLKMIDLKSEFGAFGGLYSFFKIELIIPEKNFSKTYEASERSGADYSGTFFRVSANAIHVVTRQIIDDPVIQDYILCR